MSMIAGTAEDDILTGTDDVDEIFGFEGNDVINGRFGADRLFGGQGNDIFLFTGIRVSFPAPPSGVIDGGEGIDTVDTQALSSALVQLVSAGDYRFQIGNQRYDVSGVEIFRLGSGSDTITIGSSAGAGITIYTGGGADQINMYPGASVYGGDGNDRFFISGRFGAGATDSIVDGGSGIDTLETNISFTVDLTTGSAVSGSATYSVAGFENVVAHVSSNYDSMVRGDAASNVITATSLFGAAGRAFFDGMGGDDVIIGNANADILRGGDGNDRLDGGAGDDLLQGDAGNDLLIGGGGSDTITGGAGVDRAMWSGLYQGYAQVSGGFNAMIVRGGVEGGTDSVSGVETIQFLDGALSFQTDSWQSVVYRMYDAAFDRAPDAFGMKTWAEALAGGMNLSVLSDTFEASAEFQARYGHLNNEAFITEMYRFSLNREPDAPGLQHWLNFMNGGMSRAEVLFHFSESQEHKNVMTARILADGMWIQDETTIAIARLYDAILDRVPDVAGLKAYRAQIDDGDTLLHVAQALMGQPEFQTVYGGLSNQAFVEKMYLTILNRAGSAEEISILTGHLDSGAGRADLLLGLSQALEHAILYQPIWNQQVRKLENGLYPSTAADADGMGDAGLAPEMLPLLAGGDNGKGGFVAEISRDPLLDHDDAWYSHIVPASGETMAFGAFHDHLADTAEALPATGDPLAAARLAWLSEDWMPTESGLSALHPVDAHHPSDLDQIFA